MSEWISVEDRLPDCISIQYIGQITLASDIWRQYTEQFRIMPIGIMDYRAKYWMPLPAPPES